MKVKAKKPRLNVDPLQLIHSDVHALVFQHFDGRDVLNCSEVSPTWSKLIESSAKCSSQLHLSIKGTYWGEMKPEEYKHVWSPEPSETVASDLISKRKYQSVSLIQIASIVPEIVKVLKRRWRRWKKVDLSWTEFKTRSDFYQIIEQVEQHVETLALVFIKVRDEDESSRRLEFPKLTNLDLRYSDKLLADRVFDDCSKLKVLSLKLVSLVHNKYEGYVAKILLGTIQLEELTLHIVKAMNVFRADLIPKFQFKLKTFDLTTYTIPEETDKFVLHKFLESQVESLETVLLKDWFGLEVMQLIFKMPKIRKFSINSYDIEQTIDWDNLQLNCNSSIRELRFNNYRNKPATGSSMLNVIFDAMPNLQSLEIHDLNNDSLTSIGPRCKNLETLEVGNFRADNVSDPNFFPNLKQLHCDPEGKLKQKIQRKSMKRRTHFELMLLRATILPKPRESTDYAVV